MSLGDQRTDGADDYYHHDLLAAARGGDAVALNALVAEVLPQVRRMCRARIGVLRDSACAVDDVVQEVAVALVSALPTYRAQDGALAALVHGIVRHKIADAYRAAGRHRVCPVAEVPELRETGDSPEEHALRTERVAELGQLLELLPLRQRQILTLRLIHGLSAAEVAQLFATTPGAVRVVQHRALTTLRAHVGTESPLPPPDS